MTRALPIDLSPASRPHAVEAGATSTFPLRPPAPVPLERVPPLPLLLARLLRNPLNVWTRDHFRRPVMQHVLPFARVTVVSDPAAVRHVLMDNADNYRKDTLQRRVLGTALRDGLLVAERQQWREQRRALSPLFARRTVMNFAPAMIAAADALVARWQVAAVHGPLGIAEEMSAFTLDVLVRTIFSDGLGGDPSEVRRAMSIYFDAIGRIDPFDILDLPERVPRLTRLGARPALRFFDSAVEKLITHRRQALARGDADVPQDLLTQLLTTRDPVTGRGMSEAEVRANVLTFVAAGNETASNGLTWAMMLLSMSPEWLARARQEAEAAVVGNPDTLADRLPVLKAILEETLRLYPPIVAISREAIERDELAGVEVPARSMVVVSPWIMHRHEALWERPDVFDPSRFLPEVRSRIDKFAWLPFGIGPRICIGSPFAMQEMLIALAAIVRAFDFALPAGHVVEPRLRVTLKPACGLPMLLSSR